MQNFMDLFSICIGLLSASTMFGSIMYAWRGINFWIRGIFVIIFLLLCVLVGNYSYKQSVKNAHISEFENAFKQKEILICVHNNTEYHVSKGDFIYFPEILSFMGKNENKGIKININECSQHINIRDLQD